MLQPATLTFLRQLKRNNNRPWFEAHKDKYLEAKADFEAFVEQVITAYGQTDTSLAGLEVKDCVFRIYKDVRFSKDKTPYKSNFAAGFNKGGKRVHLPGYYLHIEPGGNHFCGGGIWMPAAPELKKIRQEIDYNLDEFLGIIREKQFRKLFGELNTESALSRPPQGYSADNPAVDFLKLRSFIVGSSFSDAEVASPKLLKLILQRFTAMKPLIDFLNRAMD
ncbi:DUF2461 domain-containing protein [Compostibacter hankyongensis]|uniref:DUF2461 domain-containing protein n=1 Tax=Compostibacter hankyongensis TaxID=1007089 RepID=A0ABP8FDD4_9BACT